MLRKMNYDMKKKYASSKKLSLIFLILVLCLGTESWGQTLFDSFSDGNFTASPVWSGSTTNWGIQANSDAAAGANGSNTLRLASTGAATVYLSSQISSWTNSQEWGFWIGRRAQAFTAANQMYIWLYANEANLTSGTVDGYRLSIGDDSGGDDIRLEYIVNGAVSSTVLTSTGAITNGLTDIGFLIRVTRSSAGVWQLFTSTLPTTNGNGVIASTVPNSTNASVNQGSATNNTLVPASNGYIGVAALHSSGASALSSVELDQIYFTVEPSITLNNNSQIGALNINVGSTDNILSRFIVNVTNSNATLNTLSFNAAGNFISGDLTNFKLYTSTNNTFPGGSPLTTLNAAAIANGGLISFNSLNQTCEVGDRYFWITADVSSSTGTYRTLSVPSLNSSNFTFAAGTVSGTITAGGEQTFVSVTPDILLSSPASSSANLTQGLTNQEIYRFDLAVTTATATLNGVTINTAGTYTATDITNIKCWYSADNTFNSSSDELLSTKTTSIGTGTHVFPTFTSKTISSGSTGYIFITVDLPLTAAENNTISINAITNSDISFLSGNKTGTANASGTKTIVACTPTNVTGLSATAGNGTLTISWTNPSCSDEIMIVAKPTSSVSATPSGDGSAYTANLAFGTGGASSFDGTGFVVYKGSTSPQTITGLTNGTNYFVDVFTRKGTTWSSGSEVSATPNLVNATAILWSSSGGSAWLTGTNWTGSATPTMAQTAQFGANPTGTSVGINMGGSTNNGTSNQTTGSIEVTNSRAAALNIGNSSGSTTGTLTISGVVVNNTDNVIIRNNSNQLLTIQANQSSAMTLTLGNVTDNLILINSSGGVTITSNILGTSRNLTKRGIGTGVLSLEGANTYSGTTTVTEGTLRLNRTGGTTLPSNNDVSINGGVFRVSTNQTLNNLTFTSGELIVDAGATLTINGTMSYTAGTFTLNGNIAYGASSTVLFQNPSALNLPSVIFTNNPFNVTLNGVGGVTLSRNTTITGTLTLATGTLTVGSNTLTLNGSISRTSGNIDASNATATVVFSGSSSQSIPDGTFTGNINNLTVNNSNGLTNNQSVIIAGTLTLTAGVFDANNVTTLNSTSSLIYNGGSMINYTIPTSLNNFTLPTGTTALSNDISLSGNLNLGSNTLDIGSNTLTINGDITRTTGSIKTNGGKLILEGTSSSTLHFDQTTDGTTNKLKDLTINRTGATVTLGNKLQIAHNGTVTVTAGTLAASGNLVLTSTLGGTARIAELAAGAAVSGNVEIQRYMVGGASSQRGWRYMSSPVASSTYAQLIDDIFITGPGGASNGFDWTGNSSSVMTYEESSSRGWKNITSPSNTWNPGKGAIVFFRGDRTQTSSITNTNVAPNSFALDYSGNINSGSFTINLDYDNTTGVAANQGWNLIGNPYPSQIDWDLVTKTSGVNSHYYLINPTSKNYLSANTGIIAIGQGFFVQVNASGQSVSFEENDKTSSNGTAYFKTATNPITIKMHLDSVQNDVAKIFFVTGASKNYLFTEDAIKLNNAVYNLSIVTPDNIDVQNSYVPHLGNTGTDTFELKVTSTTNTSYYLSFDNFAQIPSGKAILLLDKQNNSITNLRLNGNYQFAINNSQSSSFGNRFLLIITDQHNSLPLKLTQFSGASKGLTNELTWVTVSEKNIIGFEVQKSDDGFDFETIGFVKANNQQSTSKYLYTDNQSKNTKVYYRLKINERNLVTFSHVVVLNNELQQNHVNQLQVFPNPAQNSLSINLIDNNNIGKIYVFDLFGKLMQQHDGVSQIDVSKLSSGSYIIQVEVNDITYRVKFTKN